MTTHADKLAAALRYVMACVDGNSTLEVGARLAASEALAEHDARTFANDCHELGDRARVVRDSNPGLLPYEQENLRQLEAFAHAVGDDADVAPDLYTEPRA